MSATFWWKSIMKNAFLCKPGRDHQRVPPVEETLDGSFHIHLKWRANGLGAAWQAAGRLLRGGKPKTHWSWVSSALNALQSLRQRKEWLCISLFSAKRRETSGQFYRKLVLTLQRIPKKIQYARWNQKNWSRTKELPRGWSWGDPTVLWLTKSSMSRCTDAGVQE